jgi:formylglycine-generating enzyme required for sulfatase activity
VWEWCNDWYGPYPAADATDPAGPSGEGNVSAKVHRGGSFKTEAKDCRVSERGPSRGQEAADDIGFRIVLPVD